MKKMISRLAGLLFASFMVQSSYALIHLPRLVSNGMVLQRDMPAYIWGWGAPGEKVDVRFNGATYSTTTPDAGEWSLMLPATKAGGPYDITISGINTITLTNVIFGDVWLCAGQLDMELPMEGVRDKYEDIIAASTNTNIRLFNVALRYDFQSPQKDVAGGAWQTANPQSILKFTTVGYFFAKNLYDKYHVPIGLINASVGGSPVEAWLSGEALQQLPQYLAAAPQWKDSAAALYNGMIAPLQPYEIKGIAWYQGEANAGKAKEYRQLLPALVRNWRKGWNQGDIPFLYVQLANFMATKSQPSESQWAELREAQLKTLSEPVTGMAVTSDIGGWNDTHAPNISEVGRRLALAAFHLAYGSGIEYSGPIYHSMKISDGAIFLKFKHTGGGLVAKGGALKYFAIAGADKKFVWANAVIKKDIIEVWSTPVKQPVAVRYAWADNPEGANLYNKEGLPAPSFRTDQW